MTYFEGKIRFAIAMAMLVLAHVIFMQAMVWWLSLGIVLLSTQAGE